MFGPIQNVHTGWGSCRAMATLVGNWADGGWSTGNVEPFRAVIDVDVAHGLAESISALTWIDREKG